MNRYGRKPNWKVWGGLALLVAVIVVIGWLFIRDSKVSTSVDNQPATSTPVTTIATSSQTVIGRSVEGRPIDAYTFGTGSTTLLFVGGMHGGYEWNSVLLAYRAIDYFSQGDHIPVGLKVAIVPVLNPDGLAKVGVEGRFTADQVKPNYATGLGRLNANQVDLNRNFDYNWQSESTWRSQPVKAGTKAFSEPEASTLRDYIASTTPVAVVFWHSQAGNVYGVKTNAGLDPKTVTLVNTYAKAGGYGAVEYFDAYPITGDAESWLATLPRPIPAVTVELKTRDSIEWEQNRTAIDTVLNYYYGLSQE